MIAYLVAGSAAGSVMFYLCLIAPGRPSPAAQAVGLVGGFIAVFCGVAAPLVGLGL